MPENRHTTWIAAFELSIALLLLFVVKQVAADEPVPPVNQPSIPFAATVGRRTDSTAQARLPDNPRVMPPVLRDEAKPGTTTAAAAAVFDPRSGTFLYGKDADSERPIASLTKLVTALTWLDRDPASRTPFEIVADDIREGSRIYTVPGDRPTGRDLLYFSLVGSANTETVALARSAGLGIDGFAAAMAEKVRHLGLRGRFSEPTGLSAENIMTASGLAQIVNLAFDRPDIRDAVTADEFAWERADGSIIKVRNTDILLRQTDERLELIGGKTGYTPEAGYCFAGKFAAAGHEVVVVVLGAGDHWERFTEAKRLALWAFEGFDWDLTD